MKSTFLADGYSLTSEEAVYCLHPINFAIITFSTERKLLLHHGPENKRLMKQPIPPSSSNFNKEYLIFHSAFVILT